MIHNHIRYRGRTAATAVTAITVTKAKNYYYCVWWLRSGRPMSMWKKWKKKKKTQRRNQCAPLRSNLMAFLRFLPLMCGTMCDPWSRACQQSVRYNRNIILYALASSSSLLNRVCLVIIVKLKSNGIVIRRCVNGKNEMFQQFHRITFYFHFSHFCVNFRAWL